jgi:hypothetical protein
MPSPDKGVWGLGIVSLDYSRHQLRSDAGRETYPEQKLNSERLR